MRIRRLPAVLVTVALTAAAVVGLSGVAFAATPSRVQFSTEDITASLTSVRLDGRVPDPLYAQVGVVDVVPGHFSCTARGAMRESMSVPADVGTVTGIHRNLDCLHAYGEERIGLQIWGEADYSGGVATMNHRLNLSYAPDPGTLFSSCASGWLNSEQDGPIGDTFHPVTNQLYREITLEGRCGDVRVTAVVDFLEGVGAFQ